MRILNRNSPEDEEYPDSESLLHLSPQIVYSSSVVQQTYRYLYGSKRPDNTPERYVDLAVLKKRLEGVGTRPLDELFQENSEDSEKDDTEVIPAVWTVTGELTVSLEEDVDQSEMFTSKLEASDRVYTSFGSKENYHPLIQKHVENSGSFYAGRVWATITPINANSTEDVQVHFCQVVRDID